MQTPDPEALPTGLIGLEIELIPKGKRHFSDLKGFTLSPTLLELGVSNKLK